jgi:hypothetical protein
MKKKEIINSFLMNPFYNRTIDNEENSYRRRKGNKSWKKDYIKIQRGK